jgi:hypothetical protein
MRLALVHSLTIPIEAERDAGAPPTSYDARFSTTSVDLSIRLRHLNGRMRRYAADHRETQ